MKANGPLSCISTASCNNAADLYEERPIRTWLVVYDSDADIGGTVTEKLERVERSKKLDSPLIGLKFMLILADLGQKRLDCYYC
jgi:hypothetical protein